MCSGTDMSGKSITSSSGKIGIVSGNAVCAAAAEGMANRARMRYKMAAVWLVVCGLWLRNKPRALAANHEPPTTNQETSMRKVAMTLLTFALGAAFAVFFLDRKSVV